jgi:hypothetical protein
LTKSQHLVERDHFQSLHEHGDALGKHQTEGGNLWDL